MMLRPVLLLLFSLVFFVSHSQTILNNYAKVEEIYPCNPCLQNCKQIRVDATTGFNVGDVVMIIQMKGATISLGADADFGTVTDYGSAGYHEKNKIVAINGNDIILENGLNANYDVNGALQIITVPQFVNYTVTEKIVGKPWDGNSGGVIAIDVSGTLTLNDSIDATGIGFRGGLNPNNNFDEVFCGMKDKGDWFFPISELQVAGPKGEGIAVNLPGYELGRGAWANGGGGGHNHNAGGGGGSNVGRGGKGGNEYGQLYCGSVVDIRNGLGGVELEREGGLRMFLGGGGGAGQENNNKGNSGGAGGGIIIISAGTVEGNGNAIISTGLKGFNFDGIQNAPGGNDGGGGGGAGGSIKLNVQNFGTTPVLINADGADGGSLTAPIHGPGGGGGGGLICSTVSAFSSNVTTSVVGGKGGVTNFDNPAEWDNYGTEDGDDGEVALSCTPPQFPPLKLSINLGPDLHLCDPPSRIINTRMDASLAFEWYRDGVLLPASAGPTYHVTAFGEYVVKVGGNGCPETSDTVLVSSSNPFPLDSVFCADGSVRLGVEGGGKYAWYDSEAGGNKVGEGLIFDTPVLNDSKTYYVADTAVFSYVTGAPSSGHGFTGGGSRDISEARQWDYLTFDALNDFRLDAIKVQLFGYYCPVGSTFSIQVNVFDQNNNLVGSVTDNPPCITGTPTVPISVDVGLDIPKGNGYYMTLDGSLDGQGGVAEIMWYEGGADMPYAIDDIISIYSVHNEFVGEIQDDGTFQPGWAPNSHPGIFDWEISSGSVCGRTPVQAIKFCDVTCEPPTQVAITEDTITLCSNDLLLINATVTEAADPLNAYEYRWYKDNSFLSTGTDSYSIASVASTETGWYKLLVEDGTVNEASCFKEDSVYVLVRPVLDAGVIELDDNICYNSIPSEFISSNSPAGGSGIYDYQWQMSEDGISWSDIAGAEIETFQSGALIIDTWFRRKVSDAEALCPSDTSNEIKVNVAPEFIAGAISDNQSICEGTTPAILNEISPATGGFTPFTYQWQESSDSISWADISGATATSYQPGIINDTIWFRRIDISATTCGNDTTNSVRIATESRVDPEVLLDMNDISICPGESATLSVLSYENEGASPSFSWEIDGVSAGSGTSFSSATLSDGQVVRVILTSSLDCVLKVTDTASALVSVTDNPTPVVFITVSPSDTVCENTDVTFTASGNGTSAALYEWQVGGIVEQTGTSTSFTHTFNSSETVIVTMDPQSVCASGTALADTIIVVDNFPINNGFASDTIKTCNNTIDLNANSIDPISAVGTWKVVSGSGVVTPGEENLPDAEFSGFGSGISAVEWLVTNGKCDPVADTVYIEKPGSLTDARIRIDGGIYTNQDITNGVAMLCLAESYTITATVPKSDESATWEILQTDNSLSILEDNTINQPLILNTYGVNKIGWIIEKNIGGCPADTAVALINIFTSPDPAGPITGPIELCEGTSGDYTIDPVPGANTYTWEIVSGDAAILLQDGTENASIQFNSQNAVVRVIPDNACGITDTSEIAVTINPNIAPSLDIVADKTTICKNDPVTFNAQPQDAGTNVSYKWYLNDAETGAITNVFNTSTLSDGDKIYAEVYPDLDCVDSSALNSRGAAQSNEITISVNDPVPVEVDITPDPANGVCEGDVLDFSAEGSNEGLTPVYNWYVNASTTPAHIGQSYSAIGLTDGDEVHVELVVSETCVTNNPAIATYEVELLPQKTIQLSLSGPTELCFGDPANFVATASDSGSAQLDWFLDGNKVAENIATYASSGNLAAGSYDVEVKVSSDYVCITNPDGEESRTATFIVNPLPDSTVTGVPLYCPGESTELFAVAGYADYKWFVNSGLQSSGAANSITIDTPSEVFVEITSTEGCTSVSDPMQVSEVVVGQANILSSAGHTICQGQHTTLSVSLLATGYAWFRNGLALNHTGSTYQAMEEGKYEVVLQYGSCADTAEYDLQVVPVPGPSFTQEYARICETDSYVIELNSDGGSVTWYNDGLILNHTGNLMTVKDPGIYYVLEDNGICNGRSQDFTLEVERVPAVSAGPDLSVLHGQSVALHANGANWYSWSPESKVSNPSANSTEAFPDSSVNIFTVTGYSENYLCSATDTIIVRIEFIVNPWNSFSPNGDGSYDYWIIENIQDYPNALVEIYNRWGNLVWESRGYDNSNKAWRGENFRNGKLLPVATYYYVIYPNGNAVKEPLTGHVTIVK